MPNRLARQILEIGDASNSLLRRRRVAVSNSFADLVGDNRDELRVILRARRKELRFIDDQIAQLSETAEADWYFRIFRKFLSAWRDERRCRLKILEQRKIRCEAELRLLLEFLEAIGLEFGHLENESSPEPRRYSETGAKEHAPIRILIDLQSAAIHGENGGLQVYVEWLIEWMGRNSGVDCEFVALATEQNWRYLAKFFRKQDVLVIQSDLDHATVAWSDDEPSIVYTALAAGTVANELNVDVFYCPLQNLPFSDPRIPTIVLLVDLLHREFPQALPEAERERRDAFFREAASKATRIQCISDSSRELLEQHFPEAKGKTFRTYLPIQARLPELAGDGAENKMEALVGADSYFLFPANFWPHKNHEKLIEAFSLYCSEAGDKPWKLVLCGNGEAERISLLQELAISEGVEGKVIFPGYVSDSELDYLWRNASALVFPSLHEGFGIPILEAMQYRVPILCSDRYSLSEVAGEAALYFDPESSKNIAGKMLELHRNSDVRVRLVEAGRGRLSEFDMEGEARKLLQEFENLVDRRKSKAI